MSTPDNPRSRSARKERTAPMRRVDQEWEEQIAGAREQYRRLDEAYRRRKRPTLSEAHRKGVLQTALAALYAGMTERCWDTVALAYVQIEELYERDAGQRYDPVTDFERRMAAPDLDPHGILRELGLSLPVRDR